jgi:hypothetical protein
LKRGHTVLIQCRHALAAMLAVIAGSLAAVELEDAHRPRIAESAGKAGAVLATLAFKTHTLWRVDGNAPLTGGKHVPLALQIAASAPYASGPGFRFWQPIDDALVLPLYAARSGLTRAPPVV